MQFIFFGASTFFSYLVYKNTEITKQTFTESEIETLKNIAKENKSLNIKEKASIVDENEFFVDNQSGREKDSIKNVAEKFANIRNFLKSILKNLPTI